MHLSVKWRRSYIFKGHQNFTNHGWDKWQSRRFYCAELNEVHPVAKGNAFALFSYLRSVTLTYGGHVVKPSPTNRINRPIIFSEIINPLTSFIRDWSAKRLATAGGANKRESCFQRFNRCRGGIWDCRIFVDHARVCPIELVTIAQTRHVVIISSQRAIRL